MRGADLQIKPFCSGLIETSPHAWSRLLCHARRRMQGGNISTCVEQTSTHRQRPAPDQKHLHMRGADSRPECSSRSSQETSPHAWSRPNRGRSSITSARNISTCVEQTRFYGLLCMRHKKHLHMRGADMALGMITRMVEETSPHAWSRPFGLRKQLERFGNISTCVEQTTNDKFSIAIA